MFVFDQIKLYFKLFLGLLVAGLGAYGYAQKKRADKKDDEIDELERQVEVTGYNHDVEKFEAVNKTKKERADADIESSKTGDNKLDPNTSY